jgi:hypothetical protein
MARCYTVTDPETGEVLGTVRADKPPSEEAVAAFRELAAVVRKWVAAEDPDGTLGERQREAIARVRRRAGLEEPKR